MALLRKGQVSSIDTSSDKYDWSQAFPTPSDFGAAGSMDNSALVSAMMFTPTGKDADAHQTEEAAIVTHPWRMARDVAPDSAHSSPAASDTGDLETSPRHAAEIGRVSKESEGKSSKKGKRQGKDRQIQKLQDCQVVSALVPGSKVTVSTATIQAQAKPKRRPAPPPLKTLSGSNTPVECVATPEGPWPQRYGDLLGDLQALLSMGTAPVPPLPAPPAPAGPGQPIQQPMAPQRPIQAPAPSAPAPSYYGYESITTATNLLHWQGHDESYSSLFFCPHVPDTVTSLPCARESTSVPPPLYSGQMPPLCLPPLDKVPTTQAQLPLYPVDSTQVVPFPMPPTTAAPWSTNTPQMEALLPGLSNAEKLPSPPNHTPRLVIQLSSLCEPAPPQGNTSPQSELAEIDLTDLPSAGSAGHGQGKCKPCAFLHTKGCENGLTCQFCHICEAGEKKRRRKEKIESQRTMRRLRLVLNNSGPVF